MRHINPEWIIANMPDHVDVMRVPELQDVVLIRDVVEDVSDMLSIRVDEYQRHKTWPCLWRKRT